jgi:hypothetical protein
MGIKLGDEKSFFACKISGCISGCGKGLKSVPTSKLAVLRMRSCCKDLIEAAGLDPTAYATHSSKRGGAIEAMKAGLSDAQIQELGRWSSSTMVARYARGEEASLGSSLASRLPSWEVRCRVARPPSGVQFPVAVARPRQWYSSARPGLLYVRGHVYVQVFCVFCMYCNFTRINISFISLYALVC